MSKTSTSGLGPEAVHPKVLPVPTERPVMIYPLQQGPIAATGTFGPIETILVLIVTVLGAYAARQSWLQYQTQDSRLRWVVAGGLGICLAILGVVSLLLELAVVLGL